MGTDLAMVLQAARPVFPVPSARSAADSTVPLSYNVDQFNSSLWRPRRLKGRRGRGACLVVSFLQQTDLFSHVLLVILARLQLLPKAKEKKEKKLSTVHSLWVWQFQKRGTRRETWSVGGCSLVKDIQLFHSGGTAWTL